MTVRSSNGRLRSGVKAMKSHSPMVLSWIMLICLLAFSGGCASQNSQMKGLRESEYKKIMAWQKGHIISQQEKALKKLPPMTARDHERLGDQYLKQGDADRAFVQYDKALKLEKNQTRIRYKMAIIFLRRKLPNEAAKEFKEILRIDGNYAPAFEGMGQALMQMEEYDEAEKYFRRGLCLNPELWRSHNFLGVIYARQLDFDKAIAEYQAAIAIKPDEGILFNNYGLSHYLKGEYEKAAKAFMEALKTEASNRKIHNNLALALGRLGRHEEALEAFKRGGDEAAAYNNIGSIYLVQGKYQEAIKAFEKAIKIKPSFYVKANENLRRAKAALCSMDSTNPPKIRRTITDKVAKKKPSKSQITD